MRIRDRRVQTTYPVRLTCQVIGHPVPEITWYKNEAKISQDGNYLDTKNIQNIQNIKIFSKNSNVLFQIVTSSGTTTQTSTPWK